ncbi:hypothetical protein EUAN_20110 [Andreesenia angusta]|uniref:Uncharacterized protein n=1 Tax=Andreesenia angusta TaxID=39480 RepID=A0A1S1V4L7_9FIRM|nr:hypothetical protein [Andreesenia angusta]OHW61573.1 hypothetical protein EUAN_20110 [Andreesenia angusta]
MKIQGAGNQYRNDQVEMKKKLEEQKQAKGLNGEKAEKSQEVLVKDKFEKSEAVADVTYKKPEYKPDENTIARIKAETEQIHSSLREMVKQLLERQGLTFKDIETAEANGEELKIEIDDETRVKAQEMIDEGGALSIESVSDRLVDFAKAISGGDKSKIGLLRDAINEGFKQAEEIFGGTLPEISHKTLARTMEKLDAWENEQAEA